MTRQKSSTFVDALTLRTIADQAATWTGYQPESVSEAALRRVLRAELVRGATLDLLRQRAADADPSFVATVSRALVVGETYFFRHPSQLEALAQHASALIAGGHRMLRAWCAGCSTGEEAYSLAAMLLAVTGTGPEAPIVDVLATDVHPGALEVARRGSYRGASLRPSGPLLHPVLAGPDRTGEFHVLDHVRARVRFALHDLRTPAPGSFELIVCRTVLL
jgi:chemotaxis protein methyltransferase CheR